MRKDRSIEVPLTPLANAQDLVVQHGEILGAVTEGRITPSEASALNSMLAEQGRLVILLELDQRIARLEKAEKQVHDDAKTIADFVKKEADIGLK